MHVDPGALVADVGHLEEIGIESSLGHGVAEKRLVGSRSAGGDHHPIQTVFGDLLLDPVLGVVGAGIKIVLRIHDVGQGFRIFHDVRDIDHSGDVGPAVTDKDSDARLFSLYISFRRVELGRDQRAPGIFQKREHLRRRCRGLHHGFRNVFRLGKRAGNVNSWTRRFRRLECGGPTKIELVERHSEAFGQNLNFLRRLHSHRQHDQVVLLGQLSVVFAQILDDQVSAARDFLDLRHARTDIAHPELLRPVVILLEALAEGAQVHEEDVALQSLRPRCSLAMMASLVAYMQQTDEQ